jgi:hypothetical protein
MDSVFISYSTVDKFFAELLASKLGDEKIAVWRDATELQAGEEWRQSIDSGIANCRIMIVVLSRESCASHYVTYEWATALTMGKAIVPVLIESCDRHPKLEPLQYIDFSRHNGGTWQILIQRLQEMFAEAEGGTDEGLEQQKDEVAELSAGEIHLTSQILGYMNKKGFRVISFSRIRDLFGDTLSDETLEKLVKKSERFRSARLRSTGNGLRVI